MSKPRKMHLWLDASGLITGTIESKVAIPRDQILIGQALCERYQSALLSHEKDQLLEFLAEDAREQGFKIVFHEEAQL